MEECSGDDVSVAFAHHLPIGDGVASGAKGSSLYSIVTPVAQDSKPTGSSIGRQGGDFSRIGDQ